MSEKEYRSEIIKWWNNRRLKYNRGLIIAGILAFTLYAILGSLLIAPHDNDFEISLFTTFIQGVGYLMMIGIANIFYGLGSIIDINYNNSNAEQFREKLFKVGFWGSFCLPFIIPLLILLRFLFIYS